jgi:hypothetical protein
MLLEIRCTEEGTQDINLLSVISGLTLHFV